VKITQQEVIDYQTVLQIELEEPELEPYLNRGYKRLAPKTNIPGFRKGKAPRRIVEQFFGQESLLQEVLDPMASEVTDKAIQEKGLETFGQAKLELVELIPFTLKATVPLTPDVDLSHYTDMRLEVEPVSISGDDVNTRIEQLRERASTWEPVERAVSMEDMVTLTAEGKVDQKTILKEENIPYVLEKDSVRPLPGFAENLVGLISGGSGKFSLSIPDDHPDATMAGQEANFSVSVDDIKEKKLPEIDDEFAKSVGNDYPDLPTLKESIQRELTTEAEQRNANSHRESVVDTLIDSTNVELPAVTIDQEISYMEAERNVFLQRMNIRVDDYLQSTGKTSDETRSEMKEDAIKRLKRSFLISKIGELENIAVSEEELEKRVDALKTSRGNQKINVDSVRQSLLTEKTIDRLAEMAKGQEDVNVVEESNPQASTEDKQGDYDANNAK
tara:strand:+ start:10478 stop:11812 length:1335 start_codon:yes stop_codon:yes gene_type:complete